MNNFPFKVGFCLNCGQQTMVRHPQFGPIGGQVGTKVCWICLCDEDSNPITRVGTITLCKDCKPETVDLAAMCQRLVECKTSGFNLNKTEMALPIRRLELVKTFGD